MHVHHPKFGLLFLNDGSLVVYVGTGNLGTDVAIDATWYARYRCHRGDGGGCREMGGEVTIFIGVRRG